MENRNRFSLRGSRIKGLNVRAGVWVFAVCDMPYAVHDHPLPPPIYLTKIKYFTSQGRSVYRNLSCPRAVFVTDKALHRGFLCYIAEQNVRGVLPSACGG